MPGQVLRLSEFYRRRTSSSRVRPASHRVRRRSSFSSLPLTKVWPVTTISVSRACAGGYVGAGHVHPALLDAAREALAEAKESKLVADGFVARCGDGIGIVLLHDEPAGSESIRSLLADLFERAHT